MSIGYAFDVKTQSEKPDWPLEIRLLNAIQYAKSKTRKKKCRSSGRVRSSGAGVGARRTNLTAQPFRSASSGGGNGASRERYCQPVRPVGTACVGPVPDFAEELVPDLRSEVDLRGRHPFLNPKGKLQALQWSCR